MRTERGSGTGREVAPRGSLRRRSVWQASVLAIVAGGVLALGCQGAAAARAAGAGARAVPLPRVHELAVDESLLRYCAHVDPKAALRLRIRLARMEQGASRGALEQLRATPQYRKTYAAVTRFTQQVDPHNARRMCGEGFQQPAVHGRVSEAHRAGG